MFRFRLLAALAILTGIPVTVSAANWVQKSTEAFVCLVPDSSWRVVGTESGVDITSPSADEDVRLSNDFWSKPLPIGSVAENAIREAMASGELTGATTEAQGAPARSATELVQRFNFTGVHRWFGGVQPIRGYMIVTTSRAGWQVSWLYAPAVKFQTDVSMLEFIRTNITPY